jgi:hypothetical protein
MQEFSSQPRFFSIIGRGFFWAGLFQFFIPGPCANSDACFILSWSARIFLATASGTCSKCVLSLRITILHQHIDANRPKVIRAKSLGDLSVALVR